MRTFLNSSVFVRLTVIVGLNLLCVLPVFAAESYQLLAPLTPEFQNTFNEGGFAGYAKSTIVFIISFSSVLAVLMITLGGFEYMLGESVHTKEQGVSHIQSAIIGLLILLFSYVALFIVNPQLLNLDLRVKPIPQPSQTNTLVKAPFSDTRQFPSTESGKCDPTYKEGNLTFGNPYHYFSQGNKQWICIYKQIP